MNITEEYLKHLTQYQDDCLCEIAKQDMRAGSVVVMLGQPMLRIDLHSMWIAHRLSVAIRDLDGTSIKDPFTIGEVCQYGNGLWSIDWHEPVKSFLLHAQPINVESAEAAGTAILSYLPEFIDTLRILHNEWKELEGLFAAERSKADRI